jgi:hypothetical protein
VSVPRDRVRSPSRPSCLRGGISPSPAPPPDASDARAVACLDRDSALVRVGRLQTERGCMLAWEGEERLQARQEIFAALRRRLTALRTARGGTPCARS